jgi:hypothetical protein
MKIVRRARVSGIPKSTWRRKRVNLSTPAPRPVNAAIGEVDSQRLSGHGAR